MSVRIRRRDTTDVTFNLTPLIDIVFQLIIFFMLLSQFAGVESTPVDLPRLSQGKAEIIKPEDKVAVTLIHVEGQDAPIYQVGPVVVASVEELSRKLAQVRQFSSNVELVLRADKRVAYRYARQVMSEAGRHGIQTIQMSVDLGLGS